MSNLKEITAEQVIGLRYYGHVVIAHPKLKKIVIDGYRVYRAEKEALDAVKIPLEECK